jgi:hypothetical protein
MKIPGTFGLVVDIYATDIGRNVYVARLLR